MPFKKHNSLITDIGTLQKNEKIWDKCQRDCTETTRKTEEFKNLEVSVRPLTRVEYHSLCKSPQIKNRVCVK